MPPRKKMPSGPVPVDAIRHEDKRLNIPTADSEELLDEDASAADPAPLSRDPSLDPQLVWKGKDEQDGEDLVVDAPPIYIQEKIAPQVIIENLRRAPGQDQLDLFADFDGLSGWDAVEYYQHDANWSNRMILGDSLQVMASLAEKENLRGKVQMIYIDPPYGIKFGSNWQVSTGKRDVKDGKLEDATREVEQIKAFRDTWELGITHTWRICGTDSSLPEICSPTRAASSSRSVTRMSHLVRCVLDEVFGSENFVAQISFAKTSGATDNFLSRVYRPLALVRKGPSDSVKYRPLYSRRKSVASALVSTDSLSFRMAAASAAGDGIGPSDGRSSISAGQR